MLEGLTLVQIFFGGCVAIMNSMAILLGSDYETVNVVLFDFIEPGLPVLLLVGVVLSLFRKTSAASKAIGWISVGVIAAVLLLLVVSAFAILAHFHGGVPDKELLTITCAPEGSFIHSAFARTYEDLMSSKTVLGMSYAAFNLLLYVLVMPCIILAEQLFIFRKRIPGRAR